MPTFAANSFQDGARVTVSALVKSPTVIPTALVKDLSSEFIVDALLRKLPQTNSGVYEYNESTPLYADGEAAIVEEFGEIPTITGRLGARRVAFTVKRALAMLVSQEMVNRNDIDRVNTQVKQIRNTMVRTWETAFFRALVAHPDIHSINAAAAWGAAGAAIRADLMEAQTRIENSTPANEPDNFYGFAPDTLVIGRVARNSLVLSTDFNSAYTGDAVKESGAYTGTLPGRFFNVDTIMVSRELDRLAPGKALFLERRTLGGVGDERPLKATPMREDPDRETWRSNLVRQSGIVIDQPMAACWINGVTV